jgi:hypothetical protein
MKPLDMADRYDPLSYQDEYSDDSEPTIKIQVPKFENQVVVDEHTRDTIPSPPPSFEGELGEKRYPGVGLLLCLVTGAAFWGTVAYFVFR